MSDSHGKKSRSNKSPGAEVLRLPFPRDLKGLENLTPLVVKRSYLIEYAQSHGEYTPFFAALTNGIQLGTRCPGCSYACAVPRPVCNRCGTTMEWLPLPGEGRIHTFTVVSVASRDFFAETPYILALIEYEGVDTLFMTRLQGFDPGAPSLDWIGKKVAPRFARRPEISPRDVYYVPLE